MKWNDVQEIPENNSVCVCEYVCVCVCVCVCTHIGEESSKGLWIKQEWPCAGNHWWVHGDALYKLNNSVYIRNFLFKCLKLEDTVCPTYQPINVTASKLILYLLLMGDNIWKEKLFS